jgi:acyl carrier protein
MNEALTWILKILTQKFALDVEEVKPSSYFGDDLNMGEMEMTELLSDLEEGLHVELMEHQDSIETVKDLVELIQEQIE